MRCIKQYYPKCKEDCAFKKECAEMKEHGYTYHVKTCANCTHAKRSYEDIDCKLHPSWGIEQHGCCNDFKE